MKNKKEFQCLHIYLDTSGSLLQANKLNLDQIQFVLKQSYQHDICHQ